MLKKPEIVPEVPCKLKDKVVSQLHEQRMRSSHCSKYPVEGRFLYLPLIYIPVYMFQFGDPCKYRVRAAVYRGALTLALRLPYLFLPLSVVHGHFFFRLTGKCVGKFVLVWFVHRPIHVQLTAKAKYELGCLPSFCLAFLL